MEFSVKFLTDSDGFLSQQCQACGKRFKVNFEEGSDQPLRFCPYCGQEEDSWFTPDQERYVASVAAEQVVGPELDQIAQDFNLGVRGGPLSVSVQVQHADRVPAPVESDEPMATVTFACCKEPVKHDGSAPVLYCVICGKELALG